MKDITYLCERVICIHDGYLTYDGELDKLLNKLSPNKELFINCRTEKDIRDLSNLGFNIKSINNKGITLKINKKDIKETLKEILTKFDVEDLDINEPPIDELIGKLLKNK